MLQLFKGDRKYVLWLFIKAGRVSGTWGCVFCIYRAELMLYKSHVISGGPEVLSKWRFYSQSQFARCITLLPSVHVFNRCARLFYPFLFTITARGKFCYVSFAWALTSLKSINVREATLKSVAKLPSSFSFWNVFSYTTSYPQNTLTTSKSKDTASLHWVDFILKVCVQTVKSVY